MRRKWSSDDVYRHIYVSLLLLLVVTTILTLFGLTTEITLYSNYTSVQKENVTLFLNTIPSQFKDGVFYFEFRADCGDMYSYFKASPIPTICITMDLDSAPYIWKAALYHELGHYVWWSKLTYYEQLDYIGIYNINNATGWLTSPYSEKSFKEGFAEDFMYFHMNLHYLGPQANNTQEYIDNVISRILTS